MPSSLMVQIWNDLRLRVRSRITKSLSITPVKNKQSDAIRHFENILTFSMRKNQTSEWYKHQAIFYTSPTQQ